MLDLLLTGIVYTALFFGGCFLVCVCWVGMETMKDKNEARKHQDLAGSAREEKPIAAPAWLPPPAAEQALINGYNARRDAEEKALQDEMAKLREQEKVRRETEEKANQAALNNTFRMYFGCDMDIAKMLTEVEQGRPV